MAKVITFIRSRSLLYHLLGDLERFPKISSELVQESCWLPPMCWVVNQFLQSLHIFAPGHSLHHSISTLVALKFVYVFKATKKLLQNKTKKKLGYFLLPQGLSHFPAKKKMMDLPSTCLYLAFPEKLPSFT